MIRGECDYPRWRNDHVMLLSVARLYSRCLQLVAAGSPGRDVQQPDEVVVAQLHSGHDARLQGGLVGRSGAGAGTVQSRAVPSREQVATTGLPGRKSAPSIAVSV